MGMKRCTAQWVNRINNFLNLVSFHNFILFLLHEYSRGRFHKIIIKQKNKKTKNERKNNSKDMYQIFFLNCYFYLIIIQDTLLDI